MRAVLQTALAVASSSLAAGIIAVGSAQGQTTEQFCSPRSNERSAPPPSRFEQGEDRARRCAVFALEDLLDDEASTYGEVRAAGRVLADYYAARSERQQNFLDSGAFFTGAGALGYAFSGPAGAATQSYWGYGALLPIILVEFNANEPTRDLFFAGRIGADLIRDRYALLSRRLTWISALDGEDARLTDTPCTDIEKRLSDVAGWQADDRAALQPTALAIADRCRELTTGRSSIAILP